MNILFCIGRNYRDFNPLNQFAQRFAKEYLGVIYQMVFCDSLESESNRDSTLKFCLDCATNLLILAPKSDFNQCLEVIQKTQKIESLTKTPVMIGEERVKRLEYAINGETRRVWLLDLECIFTNQTESQANAQSFISAQFEGSKNVHKMFLYLLGLDAASAKMLLCGIAKDFEIDLEILNTDSNLEILSATGNEASLKEFAKIIQLTFTHKIFPSFNLAQNVISLLTERGLKLTTAESCTGGLIAYWLTKESGASAVFDGGVISYANAIKESWLEVSSEHLESFGAVSEAVVREMLEGALKLSGADFALATSGIAGPSGGSINKPIGTVFIGAKSRKGVEIIERLHFKGDRNYIQEQATLYAYLLFLRIFFSDY
ncbi:CinA family protein [Helicobacter sp.]|uniref:CinA family protein n=1 Tax=Helicobacter sp. TaxID=218 RepID=UPI0019C009D5|nr:CinA family protein [Helicobacter sp.]MBD5166129.1 CinA family protein [Helicobacter sp.]